MKFLLITRHFSIFCLQHFHYSSARADFHIESGNYVKSSLNSREFLDLPGPFVLYAIHLTTSFVLRHYVKPESLFSCTVFQRFIRAFHVRVNCRFRSIRLPRQLKSENHSAVRELSFAVLIRLKTINLSRSFERYNNSFSDQSFTQNTMPSTLSIEQSWKVDFSYSRSSFSPP